MRTLLIPLAACCLACGGEAPDEPPTFNRDIAPIVLQNCAPCHRPEGSAPFDLLSYGDIVARAEQIAHVMSGRSNSNPATPALSTTPP